MSRELFSRPPESLELILEKYEKIADSDPHKLRALIPPQEIWRFFVEGRLQGSVRQWRSYLARLLNYSDVEVFSELTLEEYFKQFEPEHCLEKSRLFKGLNSCDFTIICNFLLQRENLRMITLGDLLAIDKAWMVYEENEPGYLSALYTAFRASFSFEGKIALEDILKIHGLVGSAVKGSYYSDNHFETRESIGSLREVCSHSYGLVASNSTPRGLQQILNQGLSYKYFSIRVEQDIEQDKLSFEFFIKTKTASLVHGWMTINDRHRCEFDASTLDNLKDEAKLRFYVAKAFSELRTDKRDPKDFFRSVSSMAHVIQEACRKSKDYHGKYSPLVELLCQIQKDNSSFISGENIDCWAVYRSIQEKKEGVREGLTELMNEALSIYHTRIQAASTQKEKIYAIVQLVQDCEQIHPFLDFNCRSLCIILLNILLRQQNLPLAILGDPNRFDAYSTEELYQEVLTGMENTFELIEKGELFNLSTESLFSELKNKAFFVDKLKYFELCVEAEKEDRDFYRSQTKPFC